MCVVVVMVMVAVFVSACMHCSCVFGGLIMHKAQEANVREKREPCQNIQ